jgi:hypothetical protein
VPATDVRQTGPAARLAFPASDSDLAAARIFTALEPLHGMSKDQVDLLRRAAAGLRFIRSMDTYTEVEHELFRIALAELRPADAFVVEAAACCAADLVPYGDRGYQPPTRRADQLRALWFAAILRISSAVCAHGDAAPTDVFATWTADIVYLEFDGNEVSQRQLESARTRVAALEALTGRTARVASSAARRGAA